MLDVQADAAIAGIAPWLDAGDRKSTRLNSSHQIISYAVFCLKKKKKRHQREHARATRAPAGQSTRTYWFCYHSCSGQTVCPPWPPALPLPVGYDHIHSL